MPDFTGEEGAADVLKAALEEFVKGIPANLSAKVDITYKGEIPVLRLETKVRDDLGEFVCFYRLDKMTENVFSECGRILDEATEHGLFSVADAPGRDRAVRYIAYRAMYTMILRLILLQVAMFEDNFSETMCLTASSLFGAFADIHQQRGNIELVKAAKEGVRDLLDATIEKLASKRRELLVGLLNTLPAIQIPTGVGRPPGSTKPPEKKAQEAAEFEQRVEETIRTLRSAKGEMPTKTAVAKALGIGGLNPATGIDSSLNAFNNKLGRTGVDYEAIVERVKLNK